MNLVNMAMKYAGPMIAERIASKLGLGGPVVNKLIAAAMPAILGSVIGKSSSGSGLSAIMNMVTGDNRPQSTGLADMFDADGDTDGFMNAGGGMLEGLLGSNGMGALAGALGREAGVEPDQAGSLLGMMAPVALGAVGDQVSEQGLDGPGLATFLQGQAGNVAEAMPAGFASQLDGIDGFDGFKSILSGGAGAATAAVTGAAAAVSQTADAAVDTVQDGAKKSRGMMPWIIGAVVIAGLAWFLLGKGDAPEMDTSAITSSLDMSVGDVDVGSEFTSITGSLTETFQGITSVESAQAALPQLGELTGQIGSLGETAGQLSGETKTGFQGIVATALEQLRPMIETTVSSSGAGEILQPVVDKLLAALEGLAG